MGAALEDVFAVEAKLARLTGAVLSVAGVVAGAVGSGGVELEPVLSAGAVGGFAGTVAKTQAPGLLKISPMPLPANTGEPLCIICMFETLMPK